MNDYNWEIKRGNKESKHKKVAELIETTKGEMVSTYSATAALIWLESGLSAGVFKKGFNRLEKVRKSHEALHNLHGTEK
jgi:hypothetical protein